MNNLIHFPRSWLDVRITSQPDFLQAVIYLAKIINDHGSAELSSGDAKMRFGMSPRRYRTFMALITNDKQTDKQTTNRTTSIAFDCQVVATARRQAPRQTNDKQNDKQKPTRFTPPTEQEVKDYVTAKGYHFNPEAFLPYYEKQGWKQANGQPIKDWKAACRYWETRWKEKHGERFYYQLTLSPATDSASSRKERRDRGLSLANEIVSRSENLLNLYNGRCPDPQLGHN